MRRNIFERLGVPKVESEDAARKQRVFTAGHLFHAWLQDITKQAGLSIAQEIELQDEDLMVRGHIDDLVSVNDNLILIDYKTQNSRAFSYKRPMSHFHEMQLGTYMFMLKRLSMGLNGFTDEQRVAIKHLTEARILKMDKDTLRMKEEQLMWSPQLEKKVVEYWSTLNGYWKAKKMPKCTCADFEGGFLASEKWNGYFYEDEPCSLKWYAKCKEEGLLK